MSKFGIWSGFALLLLSFVGMTRTADAGIVPVYLSTAEGTDSFRWTYAALIGNDERISAGDFFVIYDFVGFDGFHDEPSNWVFTSAYLGPTMGFSLPGDDPSRLNVAWEYSGTTPIVGPANLGIFAAESEFDNFGSANFLGRSTGNGGVLDGQDVVVLGVVTVPAAPMPEPSLATTIFGIGALLGLRWRRGRQPQRLASQVVIPIGPGKSI